LGDLAFCRIFRKGKSMPCKGGEEKKGNVEKPVGENVSQNAQVVGGHTNVRPISEMGGCHWGSGCVKRGTKEIRRVKKGKKACKSIGGGKVATVSLAEGCWLPANITKKRVTP